IFNTTGIAHQAKTPDLAGKIAKACANFKAIVSEQSTANLLLIDTLRYMHGIELRQTRLFFHKVFHSQRFESSLERLMITTMARPGVFQAFLMQHHEGFVERVERIGGSGMMICT